MKKEDQIQTLKEAMYHLEQAELLLRDMKDITLDNYAVAHINAQGEYRGDQIYQVVENKLEEIKNK